MACGHAPWRASGSRWALLRFRTRMCRLGGRTPHQSWRIWRSPCQAARAGGRGAGTPARPVALQPPHASRLSGVFPPHPTPALPLTCHRAVMQGSCDSQVQLAPGEAGQDARAPPCCCCVSADTPASAQGEACSSGGGRVLVCCVQRGDSLRGRDIPCMRHATQTPSWAAPLPLSGRRRPTQGPCRAGAAGAVEHS